MLNRPSNFGPLAENGSGRGCEQLQNTSKRKEAQAFVLMLFHELLLCFSCYFAALSRFVSGSMSKSTRREPESHSNLLTESNMGSTCILIRRDKPCNVDCPEEEADPQSFKLLWQWGPTQSSLSATSSRTFVNLAPEIEVHAPMQYFKTLREHP